MKLPARRLTNWLGFVAAGLLLAYAYYAQFVQGLEPCPLCIFQRFGMIGVGMLFLVAAIHHPSSLGARVYGALIAISAVAGGAVSARHVWLQHLPPDKVPECGPGLEYLLDVFPLTEALRMIFTGSGECADIDWSFLGLSMPAWVLSCFVVLGGFGLLRNWLSER